MIFVDGVDGRVTVARVDEHFALRRTIAVKRSVLSRSERRLQLALAGSGRATRAERSVVEIKALVKNCMVSPK